MAFDVNSVPLSLTMSFGLPCLATSVVSSRAARAGVKTLVLTHHRPRGDEADARALAEIADDVARDFSGCIVLGHDLMEIDV